MVRIVDPDDPRWIDSELGLWGGDDEEEVVRPEYHITTVNKKGKIYEESLGGKASDVSLSDANVAERLFELEKKGHRVVSVRENDRGDLMLKFRSRGVKFHNVAYSHGVPAQKLEDFLDRLKHCELGKFSTRRVENKSMRFSVDLSYPQPTPNGFVDKTVRVNAKVSGEQDRFDKTTFKVDLSFPNKPEHEFGGVSIEVHPTGVVEVHSNPRAKEMLGEYNCNQMSIQLATILMDNLYNLHLPKYKTHTEYYGMKTEYCEGNTMALVGERLSASRLQKIRDNIRPPEDNEKNFVPPGYCITMVDEKNKVVEESLGGMVSDVDVAERLTELEGAGNKLVSVRENNRGDRSRDFAQMGFKFHSAAYSYGVPEKKLQSLLDRIASCDMSKFRVENPAMSFQVELYYPNPKHETWHHKNTRFNVTVSANMDRFGKTTIGFNLAPPVRVLVQNGEGNPDIFYDSSGHDFGGGYVEIHPSGIVEVHSTTAARERLGEYNCTQLAVWAATRIMDNLPTLHLRKYNTHTEYCGLTTDLCKENTMAIRERFSQSDLERELKDLTADGLNR